MSDLVFCGENRAAALGDLIGIWEEVRAAAARRAPCLRIAVIEAERGLGKTRLAQELYRHAARTVNAGGYWPADLDRHGGAVGVMPSAARCNFAVSAAFLWWGLAVPEGTNPGNTVFAGLDALLPHLAAARIAAQRGRTDREILGEALALAADIGIEVADKALDTALGLGLVKTLGTSILRIGKLVRGRGAPDAVEAPGEQVLDRLLDDLDAVLSPAARTSVAVPMTLLVDDAQFADRDPAMAEFLERLLHRAATGDWPLLLVITHWSRQYRAWTDGDGRLHPPSHVAQVIEHARWGAGDFGRFASTPGGVLARDAITRIALGAPVDDLGPALAAAFPGISAASAAAILDRAGGNPRKLEQILAYLRENPYLFVEYHESGDLTEEGIAEVLRLSNLAIDRIVDARFHDAPADVRAAMVLASVFGARFSVDLVERLAQAQLARSAQPGLVAGEETYHFLRDVAARAERAPGFAERLFSDAASNYRRRGMARRHLAPFPEEAALAVAADGLLADCVADPAAFPGVTGPEMAQILALAAERLGDAARVLAVARLAVVEDVRGDLASAGRAARQFAVMEGAEEALLPLDVADALGAILWRIGEAGAAEAVWGEALRRARGSADRAALARALGRIGDVAAARGAAAEAVTRLSEAVAIWGVLAQDRPAVARDQASAMFRLALAQGGTGLDGAFVARAAAELAEISDADHAGFFGAMAFDMAGRAALDLGETAMAVENFDLAGECLAPLLDQGSAAAAEMAVRIALGSARATGSDWPAARRRFGAARAAAGRLMARDPGAVSAALLCAEIDLSDGRAGIAQGAPEAIAHVLAARDAYSVLQRRLPGHHAILEPLFHAELTLADAGAYPERSLEGALAALAALGRADLPGETDLRSRRDLEHRLALWRGAGPVRDLLADLPHSSPEPDVTYPLPPPLSGRWVTLNSVKIEPLKLRLEALLPWLFEGRRLRAARCLVAGCFPGRVICDLLLGEGADEVMATVIYGPGGAQLMTGAAGDVFSEAGRGLAVETRGAAVDYLRIFCAFTLGDSGSFDIIERTEQLSAAPAPEIAECLGAPKVVNWIEEEVGWIVRAPVLYGGGLFMADFRVLGTGEVEMVDDEPLAEAQLAVPVLREGPFRRRGR